MPKRILIDASHAEETRMVVLENGRMQEFDSATTLKQQIKGNIYLAKVTRVEPSLQSAFVEYGNNKHGFLPFVNIHPDYYNIPVDDKEELLKSIRENNKKLEDEEEELLEAQAQEANENESGEDDPNVEDEEEIVEEDIDDSDEVVDHQEEGSKSKSANKDIRPKVNPQRRRRGRRNEDSSNSKVQELYKKYKIQEVIKRNQIILVQVEKEERGNKGATLTTFISLAGRYCVLMPNSMGRGGVSRKIGSYDDRKRLNKIISSLKLNEDAGLIIRTAGAKKNDKEISRDYEFLASLWNEIREKTLSSSAPEFIHSEGGIIRRTIKDVYDDTTDEVLIEGKEAYARAKDFMKLMLPDHVNKIKQYKNKVAIFQRYKVEEQIKNLYNSSVPLDSGGSVVINPTEALISIDVNSGKSTSARNIEETAIATNLEAAKEIARQLRLRDLSGLIVIDFIDMIYFSNRKAVERAFRNACANDKAKVQFGRISSFGLYEMSRQRLRPSFHEVNTRPCPHCNGSGRIIAPESSAVSVIKSIEDYVTRNPKLQSIDVYVSLDVLTYLLNFKRDKLDSLQEKNNMEILCFNDPSLMFADFYIGDKDTFDASDKSNNKAENTKPVKAENNNSKENKNDKPNTGNKAKAGKKPSSVLSGIWKKIID